MNLKVAKKLRRMAQDIAFQAMVKDKVPTPERKLMVHPAHEKDFRSGARSAGRVTAVNHPESVRGIYRKLKRLYAASIA